MLQQVYTIICDVGSVSVVYVYYPLTGNVYVYDIVVLVDGSVQESFASPRWT